MAGNEDHRLGIIPVGQRNSRIGGATAGGGNTGNHLKGDPLGGQTGDLFTAPTENEGVPSLEAHHLFSLPGVLH